MPFGVGIKFDMRPFVLRLELAGKNVRRESMKAMRAGAKVVIVEVKAIIAEYDKKRKTWNPSGLTAESIGILSAGRKRGTPGVLLIRIGARPGIKVERKTGIEKATKYRLVYVRKPGGKKRVFMPQAVLHLLELGTRPHPLGKGSSLRKGIGHGDVHPGAKAQPALKPGAKRKEAEAQAAIAAVLKKAIEG